MTRAETKKNKKAVSAILACVLIAVLAVGVTLAYLSTTTDPITNNFTFLGGTDTDIDATLTEDQWVEENAKNLTPGKKVAKNPVITNTSTADGMNEYVAMRVTFQNGEGTKLTPEQYTKLMSLITIKWSESGNWKSDASTVAANATGPVQIYYYDAVLNKDAATDALFESVTINATATNEDMEWLASTSANDDTAGKGLGGFKIYVEGAAIQAEGFEGNLTGGTTLAGTELAKLFPSN